MYMLKSVISVALFAVAALAQTGNIQLTSFPPSTVTAGSPVTLTWIGGDSTAPVTITLKKGLATDLKDVGVLTSSATGGSYTWIPDTTLSNGDGYALFISQGTTQTNYSGQFSITGGSTAAPTSTTAASTTGSTTGAASSSTDSTSTGTDSSSAAASSTASSAKASSTGASSTGASSTLATSSTTRSASSSSASTSSSTVPASGASGLQSPLALLFGVIAAMMYVQ